jgi:hypothetical protein
VLQVAPAPIRAARQELAKDLRPMLYRLPPMRLAALGVSAALLAACTSGGTELPSASYGDGSVAPSEAIASAISR